jgi:hypothetical protein
MGKDSELREWALNHWKIYRSKYTGEVLDFKRSSSENWQNLKLEKPIRLIPKSSIISNILNFEIPKLKYEIEQAEEESAKVDSDPGLILELKRKYALLAMIKGYSKGGTDESVIKALDKHLSKKNPGQKKDHIFVEGKRKPHTAYAVYAKTENRIIKPSHAWRQLGQYADQSKGDKQIDLPGWGLIYLKRDREKSILRYKTTKFEKPLDGEIITRNAFDSGWIRAKNN